MAKKVVVVGGVAGDMSCAARLKRLDQAVEVTVFEKGPDVSFANCGMPYYIGGVIQDRASMAVQTPAGLAARYGLDIRTRHEVTAIDTAAKQVTARSMESGEVLTVPYDALVLAPGAEPLRIPISGADLPHVHTLNNLEDMDRIAAAARGVKKACVVGAGFIGLELAENLRHLGLEVSVVEILDQVLGPMDREITTPLLQELTLNGVSVYLKDAVEAVEPGAVRLKSGARLETGLVCMCAGVKPRSGLARDAGIALGPRGHIVVNERMETSVPGVYAVGDAVEVRCAVSGDSVAVPLAGPANRQGRVAADVICGRDSAYPGVQGTSIVKVFNLAAAQTGLTEKRLKASGLPYQRAYAHPMQHAGYYPGATPVGMKLLFSPEGRILGAQAVGMEGVDVAIDVIATAMRGGLTVFDLEQIELAYSPQWGSAKHGVNMLGFVASNILRGDVEVVEADAIPADALVLDVRKPEEAAAGAIPGSVLIPVDELRGRMDELPKDREIAAYCAVGMRGYVACRMLVQAGYRVKNINGGYRAWCWHNAPETAPARATGCCAPAAPSNGQSHEEYSDMSAEKVIQLDVCGMQCPGPITRVKKAVDGLGSGEVLEVIATDPGFAADLPAWCKSTGNTLRGITSEKGRYVAKITRGGAAPTGQAVSCCAPDSSAPKGKTIVCFSNDLDKVMAAFVIANGAAAMGGPVTIFFTFWGLNVLRSKNPPAVSKGLLDRMFCMMMPKGPGRLSLSKMNMGGMGTIMMKKVMRDKKVMSLDELIQSAKDAGVKLVACSMSMDVMGIKAEELVDGVEIGGVGAYLGAAGESNVNLFI
ncbi:MAG: DsrE/DsrF/DrsH-like family protein [Candidatus Hydrogenedentes bacterium]|nr:DsrE/DsrF/DrsH-like family protein [Candidatus Hydrogenedentota bacterium]